MLAILVEQEPIKLAPSSSQIPALLAKTKQNIFDVRAQQQAAQRYQQQRLQQRSAGPTREAVGAVAEAPGRRGSGVPQVPWQQVVAGVSFSEVAAAAGTATVGQQNRVGPLIKWQLDSLWQLLWHCSAVRCAMVHRL